jgi:fatty-acid peroxygenase
MIENAGRFGPKNWYARLLRQSHERLLRKLLRRIARGDIAVAPTAPAKRILEHSDGDGAPLPTAVAAVELINLLRPIMAISRFIVFAAMALEAHPELAAALRAGDETMLEPFVEEVRRYYPFFPVIGGRVREPFRWHGHRFEIGDWVLLDLYGTDHDRKSFSEPERFSIRRGLSWREQSWRFVPQGGGDVHKTHRCPGEMAVVELMKTVLRLLTRSITYEVPPQDLSMDLSRMPTLPKSGFRMTHIDRAHEHR